MTINNDQYTVCLPIHMNELWTRPFISFPQNRIAFVRQGVWEFLKRILSTCIFSPAWLATTQPFLLNCLPAFLDGHWLQNDDNKTLKILFCGFLSFPFCIISDALLKLNIPDIICNRFNICHRFCLKILDFKNVESN